MVVLLRSNADDVIWSIGLHGVMAREFVWYLPARILDVALPERGVTPLFFSQEGRLPETPLRQQSFSIRYADRYDYSRLEFLTAH